MEKRELVNETKEGINNDVTVPVKRMYNRHIAQVLPEFHMILAQLHRARAILVPPKPHNLEDVQIEGEWSVTWQGIPNLI